MYLDHLQDELMPQYMNGMSTVSPKKPVMELRDRDCDIPVQLIIRELRLNRKTLVI
jgi:hypothetical protein